MSLFKLQDTIFSLATASGNGAIAIIRISGEASFSTMENLFLSLKKLPLSYYIKKKENLF